MGMLISETLVDSGCREEFPTFWLYSNFLHISMHIQCDFICVPNMILKTTFSLFLLHFGFLLLLS